MDFTEQVARGKALLDAYDPDWIGKVDWDELEMCNELYCIVGQLISKPAGLIPMDYGQALKMLGITSFAEEYAHGFDFAPEGGSCRDLQNAWLEAVGKTSE